MIVRSIYTWVTNASWFSLGIAVASILLFGLTAVHAATTISTNLDTDGTLTVDGLSSMGNASSTMLSANSAYFGATATTSITSAGVLTLQNGETITNATNNVVEVGASTLKLVGTASTSALVVGDEQNVSTINGLIFGFCSFSDAAIAASSTGYVSCTGATGVASTDRVFVQATSSFDVAFVIQAASSSAANTLSLRVVNTGLGLADGTLGGTSVNFWAVRP